MAKTKKIKDEELEEIDETGTEENYSDDSEDEVKDETGSGSGSSLSNLKTGKSKTKLRRKKKSFPVKRSNPFTLRNPDGGWNLVKIGLIVAGGALLWDYLSRGSLLGVFGPTGLLTRLTSSPASAVPGAGASSGQSQQTTAGTATSGTGPNTATGTAGAGVNQSSATSTGTSNGAGPMSSGNPQWDAYMASIGIQNNQVVSSVAPATANGGSDAGRDREKFKNDSRFRQQMIIRAAQGYYYGIALVEAEGLTYSWDQWNWFRGQNGGTPIDIDRLGLASVRGNNIGIRSFLDKAGIDPLEVDLLQGNGNNSGVSGMSGLRNGKSSKWDVLM